MRVAFLLLAACTADVNSIQLTLPERGAIGLSCRDASDVTLFAARSPTLDGGGRGVTVVLDYLSFEGLPSCRPTELLRWCAENGCPVVRRNCREVVVSPPFAMDGPGLQAQLLAAIAEAGPLTDDAPDGVVVIRATFTAQLCSELEAFSSPYPKPVCEALMGCVYSCPVQLDEVEGDVLLELDALENACRVSELGVCAGIGHDAVLDCAR